MYVHVHVHMEGTVTCTCTFVYLTPTYYTHIQTERPESPVAACLVPGSAPLPLLQTEQLSVESPPTHAPD